MAKTLRIDLGERSYPIHLGPDLLADVGGLIAERIAPGRCLLISDATVADLHGRRCLDALSAAGFAPVPAAFPAGETSKTLARAEWLWRSCAEAGIDRHTPVVALGGGVTGDLAGFVAACWMRGVPLVQIPTSLLAMVDSAVGGKTAVNSPAGKNLIGAFKQPACVIVDPLLLRTMADREYRSGLAEVLKYGVIRDPDFLAWQETACRELATRDADSVLHAVEASCAAKAWYVGRDELEGGVRAHLNYGHTFAHALERDTDYARYLHGEAVGIGMRMAVRLGELVGLTADPDLADRQDRLLTTYGLPLTHACQDPAATAARLAEHTRLDKKAAGGRRRFVVPVRPGQVELVDEPDAETVVAAFAACLE